MALAIAAFSVQEAVAQCTVQYSGSLCVGSPITFTGALAGSTHDYNFNGQKRMLLRLTVQNVLQQYSSQFVKSPSQIGS
jgi:hypothetical protein